jgi:hypothetical protein
MSQQTFIIRGAAVAAFRNEFTGKWYLSTVARRICLDVDEDGSLVERRWKEYETREAAEQFAAARAERWYTE